MTTSLLNLTNDGKASIQIKYFEYLASISKLEVNKEDYTLSYDGVLLDDIHLPKIDPEDLKTQYGVDIECETRNAVLAIVTERFKLSAIERDLARCELVVNWRLKVLPS